jgi:hypothetical protein
VHLSLYTGFHGHDESPGPYAVFPRVVLTVPVEQFRRAVPVVAVLRKTQSIQAVRSKQQGVAVTLAPKRFSQHMQ